MRITMNAELLLWLSNILLGIFLAFKWVKKSDDEWTMVGKWLACLFFGWTVFIVAIIKLVLVDNWNK